MTLLDFIVIAVVLALCHFFPQLGSLAGVPFTVAIALIVERLIRGERTSTRTP